MKIFVKTSNECVCSHEVSLWVDGSMIIKQYLDNSSVSVCTDLKRPIIEHTLGSCQHSNKCWDP